MTQVAHDRCQEFLTNKEFGLAISGIVARNQTEGNLKKKGEKGGQDTRRVFTAIFSIIIFRFDAYRKGLLFTYCFA